MSRFPSPAPAAPEEEGYLASLSDLMVGLLFIFIIILMAFALNYRQAESVSTQEAEKQREEQQQLIVQTEALKTETQQQRQKRVQLENQAVQLEAQTQQLLAETLAQREERTRLLQEKQTLEQVILRLTNNDSVRRMMLQDIQRDLANRGVQVHIDEKNGILRLPEALLFDSGRADFRPDGLIAIDHLADVLGEILPCYSDFSLDIVPRCKGEGEARLEAVLIEGHTDNQPIRTHEFTDNWALASTRALNTYRTLVKRAPLLETLRNPQQQALLSVSAYEARRPVADQHSESGRRLNRRIDLRFLMASPPPRLVEQAQARLATPILAQ